MKNLIKFLAVLLLFVGYTSCDELDKLTEIDLDTTVTTSIPVTVSDGVGESVDISNSDVINIVDYINADYLDDIEDFSISSFSYKVINFSGDLAGTMTVDLMADGVILATHTGVTVSTEEGVVYTITDTTALNTIASTLRSGTSVTFAVSGTSINNGGMFFEIEITIDLDITADVA
jgi:hypothetical protein